MDSGISSGWRADGRWAMIGCCWRMVRLRVHFPVQEWELVGVKTLRSVADYQAVLGYLGNVRRVVVVGSGTLALETVETLRQRSFEVCHLLRHHILWAEVLDATASDLVLQQVEHDGVDVRLAQEVAEIVGIDGRVSGVITRQGQHIPCEMVIIAIGIQLMIHFIQRSGIACGRGVQVDGAMRTSVPDIYAAGDVVETYNPLTKRSGLLGQWFPTIQQARTAAYSTARYPGQQQRGLRHARQLSERHFLVRPRFCLDWFNQRAGLSLLCTAR